MCQADSAACGRFKRSKRFEAFFRARMCFVVCLKLYCSLSTYYTEIAASGLFYKLTYCSKLGPFEEISLAHVNAFLQTSDSFIIN